MNASPPRLRTAGPPRRSESGGRSVHSYARARSAPAPPARRTRAEAREIEVGDDAAPRRRGEIALETRELRGRGADVDLRVERHHVPGAEVVAVVAFPRRPRIAPEITEVRRGARGVVVVYPRRGTGP